MQKFAICWCAIIAIGAAFPQWDRSRGLAGARAGGSRLNALTSSTTASTKAPLDDKPVTLPQIDDLFAELNSDEESWEEGNPAMPNSPMAGFRGGANANANGQGNTDKEEMEELKEIFGGVDGEENNGATLSRARVRPEDRNRANRPSTFGGLIRDLTDRLEDLGELPLIGDALRQIQKQIGRPPIPASDIENFDLGNFLNQFLLQRGKQPVGAQVNDRQIPQAPQLTGMVDRVAGRPGEQLPAELEKGLTDLIGQVEQTGLPTPKVSDIRNSLVDLRNKVRQGAMEGQARLTELLGQLRNAAGTNDPNGNSNPAAELLGLLTGENQPDLSKIFGGTGTGSGSGTGSGTGTAPAGSSTSGSGLGSSSRSATATGLEIRRPNFPRHL